MEKDRYTFVCMEAKQGRDIFVRHTASGEEGRALSGASDLVNVETPTGEKRSWNYKELEEITRTKFEWPRRN